MGMFQLTTRLVCSVHLPIFVSTGGWAELTSTRWQHPKLRQLNFKTTLPNLWVTSQKRLCSSPVHLGPDLQRSQFACSNLPGQSKFCAWG